MFKFLKNLTSNHEEDNQTVNLYKFTQGEIVTLDQVNDPVFSQKMMGDGFAIKPTDGKIYSPVKGRIVTVFETKHAIGFETDSGIEVLLHMGVDTVALKGGPFTLKVGEQEEVTPETLLCEVDLDAIKESGKDTDMIVVITNMDKVAQLGELNTNVDLFGVVQTVEAKK